MQSPMNSDLSQKPSPAPEPDTLPVSEILTLSEIESLRQDSLALNAYAQKVFKKSQVFCRGED